MSQSTPTCARGICIVRQQGTSQTLHQGSLQPLAQLLIRLLSGRHPERSCRDGMQRHQQLRVPMKQLQKWVCPRGLPLPLMPQEPLQLLQQLGQQFQGGGLQ